MTAKPTSVDSMLAQVEEFDDLDAAYAEVRRKPYGFVWAGEKWVLPHIGDLDWRIQAEIESADGFTLEQIDSLFRRLFGPEQEARWNNAPQPGPMLEMFFTRWLAHAGAKLGEERASNDSSGNTGRSSRRTSGTSTSSASPKRSTAKRAPRKAASPPVSSST